MSYENTKGQSAPEADLEAEQVDLTVDDLVREYNTFATKSSENVLGLASTILKVEDLGRRDREWFYAQVRLDPKGSTVRKLRVIGQKLPKFQPYLSVLPNTWTTLYELAKLEDEEFKTVIDSGVLHPFVTLREIDEVRGRASAKPKQKFRVFIDLNKLGARSRQVEFARRLKELSDEFQLELKAPSHEEDLSSLIDEADEEKQPD